MLRQRSRSADQLSPESTDAEPRLDLDIEAVRVRNYDHHEGHSVNVTLEGRDVDSLLTERSYLGPGQSTLVTGDIEPGQYQLQVRVDGVERRRAELELDETGGGTAVVELGNGVVSVTRGA